MVGELVAATVTELYSVNQDTWISIHVSSNIEIRFLLGVCQYSLRDFRAGLEKSFYLQNSQLTQK